MFLSTIVSIFFHISLIVVGYYGLPPIKVKPTNEQIIDIDFDTPLERETSLRTGSSLVKRDISNKNDTSEVETIKKLAPPPKKLVNKKNEFEEIEKLIKKKPKLKTEKKEEFPKAVSKPKITKKPNLPKVVAKPSQITKKQKENLAKGLLNTLAEVKIKNNEVKKEKANKEDLLNKIKKMAGNSNRQVKETSLNFSQTDIDRISNHVRKFFNVSYAASEVNNIITLKIITNLDGTVQSVTIIEKAKYMRNKFYRAAADAARRAVLDSSPLPLPKGKEKLFTNMIFDFNTSFIKSY